MGDAAPLVSISTEDLRWGFFNLLPMLAYYVVLRFRTSWMTRPPPSLRSSANAAGGHGFALDRSSRLSSSWIARVVSSLILGNMAASAKIKRDTLTEGLTFIPSQLLLIQLTDTPEEGLEIFSRGYVAIQVFLVHRVGTVDAIISMLMLRAVLGVFVTKSKEEHVAQVCAILPICFLAFQRLGLPMERFQLWAVLTIFAPNFPFDALLGHLDTFCDWIHGVEWNDATVQLRVLLAGLAVVLAIALGAYPLALMEDLKKIIEMGETYESIWQAVSIVFMVLSIIAWIITLIASPGASQAEGQPDLISAGPPQKSKVAFETTLLLRAQREDQMTFQAAVSFVHLLLLLFATSIDLTLIAIVNLFIIAALLFRRHDARTIHELLSGVVLGMALSMYVLGVEHKHMLSQNISPSSADFNTSGEQIALVYCSIHLVAGAILTESFSRQFAESTLLASVALWYASSHSARYLYVVMSWMAIFAGRIRASAWHVAVAWLNSEAEMRRFMDHELKVSFSGIMLALEHCFTDQGVAALSPETLDMLKEAAAECARGKELCYEATDQRMAYDDASSLRPTNLRLGPSLTERWPSLKCNISSEQANLVIRTDWNLMGHIIDNAVANANKYGMTPSNQIACRAFVVFDDDDDDDDNAGSSASSTRSASNPRGRSGYGQMRGATLNIEISNVPRVDQRYEAVLALPNPNVLFDDPLPDAPGAQALPASVTDSPRTQLHVKTSAEDDEIVIQPAPSRRRRRSSASPPPQVIPGELLAGSASSSSVPAPRGPIALKPGYADAKPRAPRTPHPRYERAFGNNHHSEDRVYNWLGPTRSSTRLGLPVAKRMAERLNGRVSLTVTRELCTLTITVPIMIVKPRESSGAAENSNTTGEDDLSNHSTTKKMDSNSEHSVSGENDTEGGSSVMMAANRRHSELRLSSSGGGGRSHRSSSAGTENSIEAASSDVGLRAGLTAPSDGQVPKGLIFAVIDDAHIVRSSIALCLERDMHASPNSFIHGDAYESAVAFPQSVIAAKADFVIIDENLDYDQGSTKGSHIAKELRSLGFLGVVVLYSANEELEKSLDFQLFDGFASKSVSRSELHKILSSIYWTRNGMHGLLARGSSGPVPSPGQPSASEGTKDQPDHHLANLSASGSSGTIMPPAIPAVVPHQEHFVVYLDPKLPAEILADLAARARPYPTTSTPAPSSATRVLFVAIVPLNDVETAKLIHQSQPNTLILGYCPGTSSANGSTVSAGASQPGKSSLNRASSSSSAANVDYSPLLRITAGLANTAPVPFEPVAWQDSVTKFARGIDVLVFSSAGVQELDFVLLAGLVERRAVPAVRFFGDKEYEVPLNQNWDSTALRDFDEPDKIISVMNSSLLQSLQKISTRPTLDNLRRTAHATKGAAAQIGARSLRSAAAELEQVCSADDAEAVVRTGTAYRALVRFYLLAADFLEHSLSHDPHAA